MPLPEKLKHLSHLIGTERRQFVYVIRCEGFIKIGIAANPKERMALMQIGNPFKLRLLAKFKTDNPPETERLLHEKLTMHHHRGEWFKIDAVLQAWIKTLKDS